MKCRFIILCLMFLPFFSLQAGFVENGYDYTTRIEKITNNRIFLDNGTVWLRNQPYDPIPFKSGNTVILLINHHEYVILAKRHNQLKFSECIFDGFLSGEVLKVETLSYSNFQLSDGSKWDMPSITSNLNDWNIGDEVVVMQTPNERYHQIINVNLVGRNNDFIVAQLKN